MEEKLKKLGYKGANNPFAIYMWLIVEKNMYMNIYFSLFDKQWHIEKHIVDTKTSKWISWDYVDKKFSSYKEAVTFSVDVILKAL